MQPTCPATPILLLQRHYQHVLIESSASSSVANNLEFTHLQNLQVISSLVHALANISPCKASLCTREAECWGQIFHTTWLHFIGDLHHVNIIMNFGKISSKAQKSPYSHKNASKPIVQAHGTSSHFLAHDPSSWVSSGEFWESWFGGPKSMFSKALVVQSW